jgi:hypothetical protein
MIAQQLTREGKANGAKWRDGEIHPLLPKAEQSLNTKSIVTG